MAFGHWLLATGSFIKNANFQFTLKQPAAKGQQPEAKELQNEKQQ